MTKGELKALNLATYVANGERMAQAAKRMGIPYCAARRIMERYTNREYAFQKSQPWLMWCRRAGA